QVIDARGLYVVPGGIDAHVHFDMEFLGQSKHTFESGTIAAAFGGTTTIIDFTLDLKTLGGPLLDAVEKRREKAEGKAVIDFAFHCVVNDGGDDTLRELEQVVAYGVPSFKMFTVYREVNLYVNDATVYNVMERLRDLGGIAAVHTEADNDALWEGLAGGWLATVSSDDNSVDVEDKRAGAESFDRASPGCVDVETRIPLLFSEGVGKRRLPITRLVQVASTNPARIFGLYPRKGIIAAGSDADIVLIDPTARLRVSPQTLHMKVQYSPYEGWDVVGMPVTTISRGKVTVNKGAFLGTPGHGSFLPRAVDPAGLH